MAPVLKSLGQLSILGLTLVSSVQSFSIPALGYVKPFLRLMPLGASITDGYLSTDGNGYRKDLKDLLNCDYFQVDMVGSRKAGNMDDPDNEGWPGFRIDQIRGKAEASVPVFKPNIFTINAGTNDCAQNYQIDTAGDRLDGMLEYLWSVSPQATLIVSTLLINLNNNTESRVETVNEMIRALVARKQGDNKRIVLADMHSPDGPLATDMADDTHPNDVGYNKMAVVWYDAIKIAESRGFLQPPAINSCPNQRAPTWPW